MGNPYSEPLPYLNADPDTITMSGNSAGCFMAHQMSIIHSTTVKGVGLFACWPYGTDIIDAEHEVPASEIAEHSIGAIDAAEGRGEIDPTSNLSSNGAYVWSGGLDSVTLPKGQEALNLVYENYSVTSL